MTGGTGWSPASRAMTGGLLLALVTIVPPAPSGAQELAHDVPFVTSPMKVVRAMLDVARPTPRDSLYDLGAGDGRINIEAARVHGTPGVGIEIEPRLVERARDRAREAGVEELVEFRVQDLFEADLRPATVVTLYLLWGVNYRLRPKLFRELRPGTRVVSHKFDMGQWEPDSLVHTTEPDATIYFWVVPANVAGHWRVALPGGDTVLVELDQKFQELRGRAVPGESGPGDVEGAGGRDPDRALREARIEGPDIELSLGAADGAGSSLLLEGRVSGDRMEGTTRGGEPWSATRVFGGGQPLDRWDPSSG